MSIRNKNWYNLQSTRRYPLDESCTGLDDSGNFIRDDIVVDCNIQFPKTVGQYLYVQGLSVSAGIVTVVFGAANDINAPTGQTIAAVSLPKPVEPYLNYSVTGIVPGVSGWVVFGPGIENTFSGRYTYPTQSLLQPRNAKAYAPLPIPTIGKLNLATALQGVVSVTGATPVLATHETISYNGNEFTAIVFRLDTSQITNTENPLSEFLGPCSQRPESGTCPKQPIESINGIEPDCAGNIDIMFDGFEPCSFTAGGGIDVLTDVGLAAVCASNKPKKPQEFKDECCGVNGDLLIFNSLSAFPATGNATKIYGALDTNQTYNWTGSSYVSTGNVIDAYCLSDPTTQIDVIIDETLESQNYPCLTLPLCHDFTHCDESPLFETQSGRFVVATTIAPPGCKGGASTALTQHNVYASAGIAGINICTLKNCATDWASGKTIVVEFKIDTAGVERNGGVVVNYRQERVNGRVVTTYVAVLLDVNRARLRVLRYNGSQFVEEASVAYTAEPNKWYRMYVTPVLNGTGVSLSFAVANLAGAGFVGGTAVIANYGDPVGFAGLFAQRSYTYFNKFTVT
jgi:hypothetical protein